MNLINFCDEAVELHISTTAALLELSRDKEEIEQLSLKDDSLQTTAFLTCNLCSVKDFETIQDQREHFRSQWHRYNLRRKRRNFRTYVALTEKQFEDLSDVDRMSGDDESAASDSDSTDNFINLRQKLNETGRSYFVTDQNLVLSCYRAILDHGAANISNKDTFDLTAMVKNRIWLIMCLAGGHFAGAIFEGPNCILHKTLHRYTVRAKQGGAQSAKDSQQIQNKPRSAGANLRRHNEAALIKDIEQLLNDWKSSIDSAHLIFLRYPTYHKSLFFNQGQKNEAKKFKFNKEDGRIRGIPFVTRKPALNELQRIQKRLSTFLIHGEKERFLATLSKTSSQPSRTKPGSSLCKSRLQSPPLPYLDKDTKNVDCVETKNGIKIEKMLKIAENDVSDEKMLKIAENDISDEKMLKIAENDVSDEKMLKIAENDVSDEKMLKIAENDVSDAPPLRLPDDQKRKLYTLCKLGDPSNLEKFVERRRIDRSLLKSYLNDTKLSNGKGDGFLHCAAASGHASMVDYLLRVVGCDPAAQNDAARSPYQLSAGEAVKSAFHKFRLEVETRNESIYSNIDWTRTRIPSVADIIAYEEKRREKEAVLAEKQKLARKVKAEKAKERKLAQTASQKELSDSQRFAALSDREKRALAAERRILAACQENSTPPPTLALCQQCKRDISGQIPFEYSNYVFCTTKCVALHRKERASDSS